MDNPHSNTNSETITRYSKVFNCIIDPIEKAVNASPTTYLDKQHRFSKHFSFKKYKYQCTQIIFCIIGPVLFNVLFHILLLLVVVVFVVSCYDFFVSTISIMSY